MPTYEVSIKLAPIPKTRNKTGAVFRHALGLLTLAWRLEDHPLRNTLCLLIPKSKRLPFPQFKFSGPNFPEKYSPTKETDERVLLVALRP